MYQILLPKIFFISKMTSSGGSAGAGRKRESVVLNIYSQ